jgi:hypothetical protein
MKVTILTILLCFGFIISSAQNIKENNVPENVKESFSKKYPGLKVEQWEKDGVDYEAEFLLNKGEASAVFEANGNFKESEQIIKLYDFPKSAADYCTKNFKGYKIDVITKITDASEKVMFNVEMENGIEHFDATFDDKGNFIKKGNPSTKGKTKN